MGFFAWRRHCVALVATAVLSCVDPRTAIADANPILKEPEVALANGDDRARRLRIAGWTFVGVGAAIPVVVWSTVTHKTRDDDSLVGIARGTSFVLGAWVAGVVGGGMLGRARRLEKKSNQTNRVNLGIGWGTVAISGDF